MKGDNLGSERDEMVIQSQGNGTKKNKSKWVVMLLTAAMLLSPVSGYIGLANTAHAAESVSEAKLTKTGEEIITSGARLVKYQYTTTRSGKQAVTNINVIEADLQNPYLKLDTMTGVDGQMTVKQSVKGMTEDTGAVAGVNGDYFAMNLDGAPMGGAVSQGALLSSPSQLLGMYAFAVSKSGVPSIDNYSFEGTIKGSIGAEFPLAGINNASYTTEPDKGYSHKDAMYIYTSAWKSTTRPMNSGTTPTEALVQNGVVTDFSDGASLPYEVPEDAYIIRGHGQAAAYMRENMTIGMPVQAKYHLVSLTNGQQIDPSNFQMMIGGHTLLVDNGSASSFTRDVSSISGTSAVARTAVGYSKDKRYAYILTAEKNNDSSGLTLKELQQVLVKIGAWKAVNLDGGGSTQMVTRPLGETSTTLTHLTSDITSQRRVVNGLGIFSTAPQGQLKGMIVSGADRLYIGQQAQYTIKAYDTYFNPFQTSNSNVQWSAADGSLVWNGTSFTAKKSGRTQVIATSGSTKTTKTVEVIGADSIQQLYIDASSVPLEQGTSVSLPVKAKFTDGTTGTLPKESIKWEFSGFQGTVSNGVLTVNSVNTNAKVGYVFASYDGVKTMLPLTVSGETVEKSIENFDGSAVKPTFSALPKGTSYGEVSLASNYDGRTGNDKVLRLAYGMTSGQDSFAYAHVNGTSGISLPQGTTSLQLDAYGDGSMNWMRAEFLDKNGKIIYADVAKEINWAGWKTFKIDLSNYASSAPLKLNRLYVVNLVEGQEDRSLSGEVAFDNIKANVSSEGTIDLPQAEMKLTLGSKTATVNGTASQLDVTPIALNGTTYVPVRVILDAFGGQTGWDSQLKVVSVLRGDRYIELKVDQKAYRNNGELKSADVSPIVRSNRTLVPLRLVSEQIGLKVDWDQKSQSITIR